VRPAAGAVEAASSRFRAPDTRLGSRDLGPLGWLRINPLVVLGAAAVGPDRQATLPLPLPNDPKLSGIEVTLQAVGTHATLPPGARLSTVSWLRVR
jgi:hypothetical protein